MSLFALDSDTISLLREGNTAVSARVAIQPANSISVPVIVIEEVLSGWYTLIRKAKTPRQVAFGYDELASAVTLLSGIQILRFTEPAILRYQHLSKAKLNVRGDDLRIAAIALEHNATVVSRNIRDFNVVPGLTVEDWSKP